MNGYRLYKGAWMFDGSEQEERLLPDDERRSLLKNGGLMVLNTYDFDCEEETAYWYIVKDTFGGMAEYSSKMRNQVRKSLSCYEYRKIEREALLRDGYEVHRSAAESYKVKAEVPNRAVYEEALLQGPENGFWGAYDRQSGALAAFGKNIERAHSCNYSVLKATPEAMKRYVYYGLLHTMNQYYLETMRMDYVCDGARSLTNHSNIQPFLIEKFHFRKAYCHLDITYQPYLRPIVRCLFPIRKCLPLRRAAMLLELESISRRSQA